MIIVRLEGGLGNQMFQYAIGRQLSILNKTELKFDLSGLDKKLYAEGAVQRELRLRIFNTPINIASKKEINEVVNSGISRIEKLIYRLQRRKTIPYYRKNEIFESQWFKFDKNILKSGKNTHLTGYWQSFKYFDKIWNILVKDFSFKTYPDEKHYSFLKTIPSQNSVSLHIRLGDYVNDEKTLNLHGVCSPEYYQSAIDYISTKIVQPVFYIFSNDINRVKKTFTFNHTCVYVSETPAEKDYFDMHLMSLCKHNIIANSSFSWWGARLNNNPDKIVIAPKKWMADSTVDTTDLIPEKWIRL